MAIDRPLALRNAEKLLRQGKLDAAIAEYRRVVEDQPRDWSTANVLGDLYLRAGQADQAVAQFARIADSLSREGFWPKAAAVYKKIIRLRPDNEHAWLQAGEMAAQLGVLVDARACLNTVAERRLARGDRQGAAEIRLRLASLDPSDFDVRRAAARARVAIGDLPGAVADFKAIAADLADHGRPAETAAALLEAAELDPADQSILEPLFTLALAAGDLDAAAKWAATPDHFQKLGQAHVARGDIESAARFLTAENAAHDPVLLLKVAAAKLLAGARDEGLGVFRRLLNQEPSRSREIARLGCEIARSAPDAGFAVVEIAAETLVIEGDFPSAAAVLLEFVAGLPNHIPALMGLVEICVDGGLDATLNAAESQLADAYLAAGVGAEARIIAEDLIARYPAEPSHIDQLRRALVLLGESDPDRIIAERMRSAAPDETDDELQTVSAAAFEAARPDNDGEVWLIPDAAVAAGGPAPDEMAGLPAADDDAIEVDLSDLLGDFANRSEDRARAEYEHGVALRDEGRLDESIWAFQAASCEPLLRFDAAGAAARLHRQRGDLKQAVDWFEQAARAPAPSAAEAHSLRYDLAGALESLGEIDRALAVCLDLQTDAGAYRDLAARISRLARIQARG